MVLQPTAVYGPWGGVWTAQAAARASSGRQILVDGGDGMANAVYVDDLVSAMLLAAVRDGAVGEAFLISGPEPASWKDLYGRFAAMLGDPERRLVAMSAEEARAHWQAHRRAVPHVHREVMAVLGGEAPTRDRLLRTREMTALRELASATLPERWQESIKERMARPHTTPARNGSDDESDAALPIHPLTPDLVTFFAAKTRVRIEKARRLLGWEPAFALPRGMELTEQWARWAGLLGR